MGNTSITWTEKVWNPTVGCKEVSAGCDHCYAKVIAERWRGGKAFPNGFDLTLHPERLQQPHSWKKPQMVFVNSMSDLFHKDIPADFLRQVWDVMEATPRHTYQILTKRPERMRHMVKPLPVLPNVWLGTSIESEKHTDRLASLLSTPAAIRFVSAEPLLDNWVDSLPKWTPWNEPLGNHLQWVILGGESGAGARPCDLGWIRAGLAAVRAVGAAPFVKQLGTCWARAAGAKDYKGEDPAEWPEDLRVREYPTPCTALEVSRG